jgi:hypothetical protein
MKEQLFIDRRIAIARDRGVPGASRLAYLADARRSSSDMARSAHISMGSEHPRCRGTKGE